MHDDDERDEAWEVVKRWPALSGPAKSGWLFLWRRAGRRPDTIWVGFSEWAAEYAKSDRSARRWCEALSDFHLVDVVERAQNCVRLYVKEPREVCRARGGEGITEQRRFAQLIDPSSPADVEGGSAGSTEQRDVAQRTDAAGLGDVDGGGAAEPPRNRRTSAAATFGKEARAHALLPSVLSEPLITESTDPRSASAGAAEPPNRWDEPKQIGAALVAAVEQWSKPRDAVDEQREVDRIVKYIQERVADPLLRPSPCVRVARAMVRNRLPRGDLASMLTSLDKKAAKVKDLQRWVYFVGAAMRTFERRELKWSEWLSPSGPYDPSDVDLGR